VFEEEPTNRLLIASPNGGEAWQAATSQTIRWTYAGNPGSLVRIELLKGGSVNSVIASSAPVGSNGSGSFVWRIPSTQLTGNDYAIRITSVQNASTTDMSDDSFTINGPPPSSITVTLPNGGEAWRAGTSQAIKWTYAGNAGMSVRIELLKGSRVNRVITSSAPIGSNGSGSYAWRVPSTQVKGNDYTIRITSVQNTAIADTSDTFFVIK
jgi:hypothetical protein